jgi:hypothetical protein
MMITTTILNDVIMQNAEKRNWMVDGRWSVVGGIPKSKNKNKHKQNQTNKQKRRKKGSNEIDSQRITVFLLSMPTTHRRITARFRIVKSKKPFTLKNLLNSIILFTLRVTQSRKNRNSEGSQSSPFSNGTIMYQHHHLSSL